MKPVRVTSPPFFSLGRVGLVLALVGVWVLLWGEPSLANLASGLVVAVGLLIVFPLEAVDHVDHRLRPIPALRLAVHFAVDLVVSTLVVARQVIGGPSHVRTAIIGCPLRVDADGLITFLANVIALSPGTLPVHVDRDPLVLYVHVLRLESAEDVRRRVSRLEELAVAALGSPAMVEACRQPPPPFRGADTSRPLDPPEGPG